MLSIILKMFFSLFWNKRIHFICFWSMSVSFWFLIFLITIIWPQCFSVADFFFFAKSSPGLCEWLVQIVFLTSQNFLFCCCTQFRNTVAHFLTSPNTIPHLFFSGGGNYLSVLIAFLVVSRSRGPFPEGSREAAVLRVDGVCHGPAPHTLFLRALAFTCCGGG